MCLTKCLVYVCACVRVEENEMERVCECVCERETERVGQCEGAPLAARQIRLAVKVDLRSGIRRLSLSVRIDGLGRGGTDEALMAVALPPPPLRRRQVVDETNMDTSFQPTGPCPLYHRGGCAGRPCAVVEF